jgi:hypothetical protein
MFERNYWGSSDFKAAVFDGNIAELMTNSTFRSIRHSAR